MSAPDLTRTVQLAMPGADGRPGEIVVDGHDLSGAVSDVHVHASARGDRTPVVRLGLSLRAVDTAVQARVVVEPDQHDALVALGWTPPGGTP